MAVFATATPPPPSRAPTQNFLVLSPPKEVVAALQIRVRHAATAVPIRESGSTVVVIVGGGVALIQAAKKLDQVKTENPDQEAGVKIIARALEAPLRQIAENAGVDGSVVAGKIRESSDMSHGFNAQTEEYGDMFKFGVIDPAKVVRTALEDASSVAGLLITTEAMVADRPEPKSAAPAMPDMGGMGGMGGMM